MKKSVCCAAIIALAFTSPPFRGLVWPFVATAAQAQASVVSDLKTAIREATGYQNGEVDLRMTRHLLTVILVNSKLAADPAFFREFTTEREAEAAQIVSTVTRRIASNPELKTILAIRIEYVSRDNAGRSKVLDIVEFRKTPQGEFVHHAT